MAYLTTAATPHLIFGEKAAALLHNTVARILRGHYYRQTLKSLRQLSADELEDLGLSRFELRSVAREAARVATS